MRITLCLIALLGVMIPVAGFDGYKEGNKGYQFSKHFEKSEGENYVALFPTSEIRALILTFKQVAYGLFKFLPLAQVKNSRIFNGESLHPTSRLV